MFLAAFIPGILAALGYILAIALYVRFVKDSGPTKVRIGWKERFSLFKNIWQIILIFIVMIGGIYLGWFTPTEGGAIGAGGAGLIAMLSKNFKLNDLIDVIESTAVTSAMIFLVLLGAEFFNSLLLLLSCLIS
jgi:TRAP-type C4-dicarboxylate transport system permease large subunit